MMEKKTNLKKLDPAQLSLLCAQWAMILKTGILLYDGADILVSTYENTSEQALFERIAGALEEGQPFYEALESTGRFPKYMIEMVRIAERTGNLDVVLDSLSKYYKKEALRNENIQNAIFYPVTLVVMMSVVIAILVVKVIPVFMQVFRNMGVSLDGSTQTILSAGIFVGYAVMVFAILLSVFAIVVIAMWKKGKTETLLKGAAKIFPFFRKIHKGQAAARYADIVAMAMRSGFSLDETMEMAPDFMPDAQSRTMAQVSLDTMRQTNQFTEAIIANGFYDTIHEKMIEVGDQTGQIESVMTELADLYNHQVESEIDGVVASIEPVLVALLTLIVGGILLAIMLPLVGILMSMT